MNNPKVIIIILIIIAIVFVVAVLVGIGNDGQRHSKDKGFARSFKAPGWANSLGSLGSGPKLKLDSETVASNTCGFDAGTQTLTITSACQLNIKAAEEGFFGGQSLRTANLRLLQGSVTVNYQCRGASNDDLCPQDLNNSDFDKSRASLVILKGGGTITFTCTGPTPCKISFEQ